MYANVGKYSIRGAWDSILSLLGVEFEPVQYHLNISQHSTIENKSC